MEEYRAEQGSERNAGDCMDMLRHLISCRIIIIIITRNSLVRAKGEVLVLLYVFWFFLFVRSTISRQPAGRFTTKFACGRTLVGSGCVFSPFGGWRPPAGGKRGK